MACPLPGTGLIQFSSVQFIQSRAGTDLNFALPQGGFSRAAGARKKSRKYGDSAAPPRSGVEFQVNLNWLGWSGVVWILGDPELLHPGPGWSKKLGWGGAKKLGVDCGSPYLNN